MPHPYALRPGDLHELRKQGFEIRFKTHEEILLDIRRAFGTRTRSNYRSKVIQNHKIFEPA